MVMIMIFRLVARIAILVVALFLFSPSLIAQSGKFNTLLPSGEEFSVQMPGMPTKFYEIIPVTDGFLSGIVYDSVADNLRYQVLSVYKNPPRPVKALSSFEDFRLSFEDSFIQAGSASRRHELGTSSQIQTKAYRGVQYKVQIDSTPGIMMSIDGPRRYYVAFAIGGTDSVTEVKQFLDSFKITGGNSPRFPETDVTHTPQPTSPPQPWFGNAGSRPTIYEAGIVNGHAYLLPLNEYPKNGSGSGRVTVNVVVDENGSVISATGADGPSQFWSAATKAALKAKFMQTFSVGQAIKVSGKLVYNFIQR